MDTPEAAFGLARLEDMQASVEHTIQEAGRRLGQLNRAGAPADQISEVRQELGQNLYRRGQLRQEIIARQEGMSGHLAVSELVEVVCPEQREPGGSQVVSGF
jgi:hypothetical protein